MKSGMHWIHIFYRINDQNSLRCKRAELTIGLVKEFYIVDENILGHDLNFKLFEYQAWIENSELKEAGMYILRRIKFRILSS